MRFVRFLAAMGFMLAGTPAARAACDGFFDFRCTLDDIGAAVLDGIVTLPGVSADAPVAGSADWSSTAAPQQTASAQPSPSAPLVRASRIFSGPSQYPPAEFAAYGIVAFPSLATPADRARHVSICKAYVAVLPNASQIPTPRSEQMVTVWPVKEDALGDRLTQAAPAEPCEAAVDGYGQLAGLRAIRMAEQVGGTLGDGSGPFLLAWSPGSGHGSPDAHVLRVDMSHVRTEEQAKTVFRRWTREIEGRPELWQRGWDLQAVRIALQGWADDMGARIMPE